MPLPGDISKLPKVTIKVPLERFESIRSCLLCSRGTLMSYNDRSVQRKQPKPGYFRQFRNPGQNVSLGSVMSGHLIKNILMMDLFQLLSSQDVNWWTGVVWIIVMFLSAVWTLILTAPIHCRGSIGEQVMQWHISPNLMKKQTHLHLDWPEGEWVFSKCSYLGERFL